MKNKNNVGVIGESIAAAELVKAGYKIIKRNYHSRYGEIDIIATNKNILAFVEVKTRTSLTYGEPKEAVTFKKQQKIKKTALDYILKLKDDYFLSFDVCEILLDKRTLKLKAFNHIKNAFY